MILILKNKLQNNKMLLLEQGLAFCAATFSRISLFLVVLINTQYLDSRDFGTFSIILLMANIINAMVSCGGDMWLNRFTRYHHTSKNRTPLASRFYIQISIGVACLIAFSVLVLYLFNISRFFEYRLTILYALIWAISGGLIETILAILRTTSGIKRFFIIRDIIMPALLIYGMFIFKIHCVCTFFLLASFIWVSVLMVLSRYMLNNHKICLPKSSLLTWKKIGKGLFGYTFKLILNNFSSRISNGLDSLLLVNYLTIDLVGKYRLAAQFANAILVIQHFVFLTLPWHMRITNCVRGKDGARIVQFRNKILLYTAAFTLVLLLITIKPVLNLFGNQYSVITPILSALLLIRFSEVFWGPQHEILISNNKIFEDTFANITGLLIGSLSFFMLIQYYDFTMSGIISAGLNSFCTQLVRFMILRTQVYKRDNSYPSNAYLPWLPVLLIITGVSYATL